MTLQVLSAGPGVIVTDLGRPGYIGQGVSTGGAADRLAHLEGAALLGNRATDAGIEMAGFGGTFRFEAPTQIALTGAPMRASLEGAALDWNTSHPVAAGQTLTVQATTAGNYGYLSLRGGLQTEPVLGSRATNLTAGIGAPLAEGARLPYAPGQTTPPMTLSVTPRFEGGTIRIMEGPQSHDFDAATRARLAETSFRRSASGNRQGMGLDHEGAGFTGADQLVRVSDFIVAGDVQMTGEGMPYVLIADCQTMGGYPRIGTVLPADLPIIAQAPPGAEVRFRWVTPEEARASWTTPEADLARLKKKVAPKTRDPAEIADLLTYQLVGGVISATQEEEA